MGTLYICEITTQGSLGYGRYIFITEFHPSDTAGNVGGTVVAIGMSDLCDLKGKVGQLTAEPSIV